jgi:hypothetical protein
MYVREDNQSFWGRLSEKLGEIEAYKRSFIGINYFLFAFHNPISEVDPFVCQIIDCCLQITTFHSRHNVCDGVLNCDVAIMLV